MILSGEEILKYLPHRDPFLFIDEVISLEDGKNIHAVMHYSMNIFTIFKRYYFVYKKKWISMR